MGTDHIVRRAKRLKIFEPFLFVDQGAEWRAHLLDISETGALVHCDGAHEAGGAVTLKIRGRSFGARIIWAKAPRLGVAFSERIQTGVIEGLIGR